MGALNSTEVEKLEEELCDTLVRTGVIKFGVFKLTSGKLSPYYIDLRVVPSFPSAFRRAINAYEATIDRTVTRSGFDRIVGIPTAGVPFASTLSYRLEKPFLYIRRESKGHGRERKIEGLLFPGEKVLVVDDLITTGKSTVDAVKTIRSEGGLVTDAVVLVDRQEGGSRKLEELGVALHSFMKMSDVARRLLDMGAIDEDRCGQILKLCK